ncbi:hypothetical protein VTO73DRAFT_12615 [Trametes versicolor]
MKLRLTPISYYGPTHRPGASDFLGSPTLESGSLVGPSVWRALTARALVQPQCIHESSEKGGGGRSCQTHLLLTLSSKPPDVKWVHSGAPALRGPGY